MKNLEQGPPIGIIVTHPASFFKQYSHDRWLRSMELLNTRPNKVWYRVMKNLPKHPILYVYTVYDGKVQHRCNFAGEIRNKNMSFPRPEGGRRHFENANAIILCGPFVKAPHDIPMKGFQGFNYVYQELF